MPLAGPSAVCLTLTELPRQCRRHASTADCSALCVACWEPPRPPLHGGLPDLLAGETRRLRPHLGQSKPTGRLEAQKGWRPYAPSSIEGCSTETGLLDRLHATCNSSTVGSIQLGASVVCWEAPNPTPQYPRPGPCGMWASGQAGCRLRRNALGCLEDPAQQSQRPWKPAFASRSSWSRSLAGACTFSHVGCRAAAASLSQSPHPKANARCNRASVHVRLPPTGLHAAL